ncbi:MAG: gamma-glutamylcyclotransferase [Solirubrobacteraceae bacterium]
MPELLAVYGTLMSGQSYEGRPDVERMMRSLGPCRIPGALYSEGDYPWLVQTTGEVAGELYEVLDPDRGFAILDAYENEGRHTDDGAGRYARVRLTLLEPAVEAWVYVWEGEERGEPIDDGDWRTWLALRGDR